MAISRKRKPLRTPMVGRNAASISKRGNFMGQITEGSTQGLQNFKKQMQEFLKKQRLREQERRIRKRRPQRRRNKGIKNPFRMNEN